jgi:tetratricopeptide (TPR) repeat protein
MAMKANLLFQTVNFGVSTDEDRITEARRLAEVAIAEDPGCAPAYSALAWIQLSRLRQAAEGVEYAERAYELDPSDTAARIALVVLPLLLGISRRVDPDEVHQRMVREDPLFPAIHAAASMYTASRGLWEASLELIDRSLELEWNGSFRVTRAFALLQFDRRTDAESTLARDLDTKGPMAGLARALYHALQGDRPQALASLDEEVFAWARPDGEYAWHLARTYTILGDHVEALRWLDRAVDCAFWNWRLLAEYDRVLAPLRDEPEFERIVDRSRRQQLRLAERWGRALA